MSVRTGVSAFPLVGEAPYDACLESTFRRVPGQPLKRARPDCQAAHTITISSTGTGSRYEGVAALSGGGDTSLLFPTTVVAGAAAGARRRRRLGSVW